MVDDSFEVLAGVELESAEGVLPGTVSEGVAQVFQGSFELVMSRFVPESLLFEGEK